MRWRLGEGRAVGSFALLITLVTYASPSPERTLWRWSSGDAAILAAVALIFGVTLIGLIMPATGPIDGGYRPPASRVSGHWIDIAWVLWGLGYLIGSAFAPSTRGRLFQLDLLGSVVPGASFLEWGGLVALLIALGVRVWRRVGRRSWPLAVLLSLPLAALAVGEGWARGQALYRPRVTALPSAAQERWARAYVTLNGAGFRDATHEVTAPAGTSRLLLLGGSDAFGIGIDEPDDRLSELVALRLNTATGRPWESINVGQVGTHTKEHLALLQEALRWHPDVVVLLYAFDDISYFAPVDRPELLAGPPSDWLERLHPLRLAYTNSVLFQELFLRLRARFPAYTGTGPLRNDPYADSTIVAAHLEDLKGLVQAAEETGAAALVVPVDVEVASDSVRLGRYRAFVAAVGAADIVVVGVDRLFLGQPADRFIVNAFDRHPNALAYRLVADTVARQILYLMGATPGQGAVR